MGKEKRMVNPTGALANIRRFFNVMPDSAILMQYTGMKDKNGVEIWEGDVIKSGRGDWGVIVWKAPFFEVTVSEDQSSLYTKEWIEACEVIGNIYENPNLLNNDVGDKRSVATEDAK